MSNIVKKRLQETFKKIEDNFQSLAKNDDIKKVLKEMQKLRAKEQNKLSQCLISH